MRLKKLNILAAASFLGAAILPTTSLSTHWQTQSFDFTGNYSQIIKIPNYYKIEEWWHRHDWDWLWPTKDSKQGPWWKPLFKWTNYTLEKHDLDKAWNEFKSLDPVIYTDASANFIMKPWNDSNYLVTELEPNLKVHANQIHDWDAEIVPKFHSKDHDKHMNLQEWVGTSESQAKIVHVKGRHYSGSKIEYWSILVKKGEEIWMVNPIYINNYYIDSINGVDNYTKVTIRDIYLKFNNKFPNKITQSAGEDGYKIDEHWTNKFHPNQEHPEWNVGANTYDSPTESGEKDNKKGFTLFKWTNYADTWDGFTAIFTKITIKQHPDELMSDFHINENNNTKITNVDTSRKLTSVSFDDINGIELDGEKFENESRTSIWNKYKHSNIYSASTKLNSDSEVKIESKSFVYKYNDEIRIKTIFLFSNLSTRSYLKDGKSYTWLYIPEITLEVWE